MLSFANIHIILSLVKDEMSTLMLFFKKTVNTNGKHHGVSKVKLLCDSGNQTEPQKDEFG